MANELRFLGGNLLFDGGKLAMAAGCCCCDCETEGPTADFSYQQTDDSPCEISLYDESVEGECGVIVSWRWLKNGVQFSTSQNPTGITVTNGDDITLEVTDYAGCTDSVVMEIACVAFKTCGCCSDLIPPSVVVTSSGFSNDVSCLTDCTALNGVFVVPYLLTSGGVCTYLLTLAQTQCDGSGSLMNIIVRICVSGKIQVSMNPYTFTNYLYEIAPPAGVCRGTHTLTLSASVGVDYCNEPASIQITI